MGEWQREQQRKHKGRVREQWNWLWEPLGYDKGLKTENIEVNQS